MPVYRFYTIGPNGHIGEPPALVECHDDLRAIKEARKLIVDNDIEVWQGTRIVAYLVPESFKAGGQLGARESLPPMDTGRRRGN